MKATPEQERHIVSHLIASDLRIALDGWPEKTIEAFVDEDLGNVVGIMLEARLEDVGNGESGPRLSIDPIKFAQVYRRGNYWYLGLFDYTDMPNDLNEYNPSWEKPFASLHMPELDGEERGAVVAKHLVKVIKALGLTYTSN